MVFTFVKNIERELRSVPIVRLPATIASTIVVPPPMYGSRTISPGFEKSSIAVDAKLGENRAGYL
ncbi:hypothetical protein ES705_49584 [subsurface metagenome]